MDTAWTNASLSSGSQFNGLYDELLSFDVPTSRQQIHPAEQSAQPVTVEQVQAAEMNRKRKLDMAEKESLEIFLAQLGSEEPGTGVVSDSGAGMKRKDSGDKDAKLDTARNKACRERARRERLNDSFAELSKALDPRKDVKTDKTSIVADAIRVVTQLRAENGQLKQLNKFLEERVGTVEKQKADLMLQQAFLQQQANGAGPSVAPQLPPQQQQGMQNAFGVAPGVPVGHFNQQPAAVMQFMGLAGQNSMSMGIPPQQAIAPGIAAGMMQHTMQPQQSVPAQGMQPQALHGDIMMQQHTHSGNVNDQINSALNFDGPYSAHDLLEDGFPSFPSPALDSQSSSGQQQDQDQAQRAASNSQGNSSHRQQQAKAKASLAKNPSLQRNMRKLAVNNRAPSVSTPDDLFSNAMQNAQMQLAASMPMVGPGSWLSPSTLDTSQDSIRRPPAA